MASGFLYGSGRSKTVFTTLKIAVFAPMPRVIVINATSVKPGLRIIVRSPKLRSFDNVSMKTPFRFLVSGFWSLVSGFWFLVSGLWFRSGDPSEFVPPEDRRRLPNQKPETRNQKPETKNQKLETRNPEPTRISALSSDPLSSRGAPASNTRAMLRQ